MLDTLDTLIRTNFQRGIFGQEGVGKYGDNSSVGCWVSTFGLRRVSFKIEYNVV